MTHVQTEVSEEEYARLRALARERGLSIREALREATERWIEDHATIDSTDPIFTTVDRVRDDSASGGREPTTVTTEDDLVDEWRGDAERYRLADPR